MALIIGLVLSITQAVSLGTLMDQANALPAGDTRIARQREILQFEADNLSKIWTTLVQAIVAVVLAVGGYFTYRNLRVAQDNLEATKKKAADDLELTQKRLDVDREAQVTNRFTQAIGQLGAIEDSKPNLEVRLGGIYALERIARDSPPDHWTITEILTAYVRENARWIEPIAPSYDAVVSSPEDVQAADQQQQQPAQAPPVRADVQAVLTVIGRRIMSNERVELERLDLHRTALCRALLNGAHLERTNLAGGDLREAILVDAHLREALLDGADLRGARLRGANLQAAHLGSANLDGADLGNANLQGALLGGAQLRKANAGRANLQWALLSGVCLQEARLDASQLRGALLSGADLRGTVLGGADLQEANFGNADLQRAYLRGANLNKADFRTAKNLEYEQVFSSHEHGTGALLPPNWPADWRDRFGKSTEQPPATPSAP